MRLGVKFDAPSANVVPNESGSGTFKNLSTKNVARGRVKNECTIINKNFVKRLTWVLIKMATYRAAMEINQIKMDNILMSIL